MNIDKVRKMASLFHCLTRNIEIDLRFQVVVFHNLIFLVFVHSGYMLAYVVLDSNYMFACLFILVYYMTFVFLYNAH